jgi:hypothetical protein
MFGNARSASSFGLRRRDETQQKFLACTHLFVVDGQTVNKTLGKIVDERTRPGGVGYIAERHELIPNLILIWGPCECVWIIAPRVESFLTPCGKSDCSFKWEEARIALAALAAFELAEQDIAKQKETSECALLGDGDKTRDVPVAPPEDSAKE